MLEGGSEYSALTLITFPHYLYIFIFDYSPVTFAYNSSFSPYINN